MSKLDPLEMLLDAARFIERDKPEWAKAARESVAAIRAQSDVRAPAPHQGEPVAWRWKFHGQWFVSVYPAPNKHPCEPLYAGLPPSAAIAEDCAKIAEGHVGAANDPNYDEACRDIAKAIRDTHIVEGVGK